MSSEYLDRLTTIHKLDRESQRDFYYNLGRMYLQVAGVPQETIDKVYKDLVTTKRFWRAKYMDKTGKKPGMDIMDAFRCLVDTERTHLLASGIQRTVESLKNSGQTNLTAIDAGTGTSILSLIAIAAGCDKAYALEINPDTAKATKKFLDALGLSETIEVIECDATRVDLGELRANLLISENLSNGLFDEPQYKIISHLSNFLRPDAKIIPFKSEILASLRYSSWKGLKQPIKTSWYLKDLKQISVAQTYFEVYSISEIELETVSGSIVVVVPVDATKSPNTLTISTRFYIDDGLPPLVLEPDTAKFLGKSGSFKLEREFHPGEIVEIDIQYPTGMRRKDAVVTTDANKIILRPNKKYEPRKIA